jgi:hypothetical protein
MAGTIDLNGMGGSLHSVDKLFVHQNYTKQFQADVQGDIALLRLAKRFSYDSNIQPIKLGTVYDGAKAVVVGWGSESNEYPCSFADFEVCQDDGDSRGCGRAKLTQLACVRRPRRELELVWVILEHRWWTWTRGSCLGFFR